MTTCEGFLAVGGPPCGNMKPLHILAVLLAVLMLVDRRPEGAVQDVTREAYPRELVRLVTELQKNPWEGWPAGTRVVVRYLIERNSKGKALGREQPDIVFTVVEADRSIRTTQLYKGKTIRRDFLIKDQIGLDAKWPAFVTSPSTPTNLTIDRVNVACLRREMGLREIPGGTIVTREWAMVSHPSVVLRKETVDSNGWEVTSAQTRRSIGEKDFQCLEVRLWTRFYHNGPNDAITMRYLCPGVPGHVAEERIEYYKVVKGQRGAAPNQIQHQKTVELSSPLQ